MKHFYQDIHGMTDYEDLYSEMVKKFPNGSYFVEVGSYKGKSAAFMGVEIVNSGKEIKFDIVDHFEKSSYEDCRDNLKGLSIMIRKLWSKQASALYEDEALDFVFIDAGHSYEDVLSDIRAWLPKVKAGGILAGHDYENERYPGVKKAVDELLPEAKKTSNMCWMYLKNTK